MNNIRKKALLIHNPGAGGADHSEEELLKTIRKEGFTCKAGSFEKGWKSVDDDTDFIVVAGGDGTIRKTAKKILDRGILDRSFPLGLLPLGTANNIAATLGIEGKPEELIASWKDGKLKQYDVGIVRGDKKTFFFLESYGYGIFPYLMQKMKQMSEETNASPAEKIQAALKALHEIILSYQPKLCKLKIDGIDHSGNYLLAEIMNTRSIGPNLVLSPDADPGDGTFDVVLVPEADKEKIAEYVNAKISGNDATYHFLKIPARHVVITWNGKHAHTDDEIVKIIPSTKMDIELKEGLIEFIVPSASVQ